MKDQSFEDLKTLFAADLSGKIIALKAAIRDANWDAIRTISHQISGVATSFGYPEISMLASELERSVEQNSLDYSADLVKKISELFVL